MSKKRNSDERIAAFVATLSMSEKRNLFVLLGVQCIKVRREPAKAEAKTRRAKKGGES